MILQFGILPLDLEKTFPHIIKNLHTYYRLRGPLSCESATCPTIRKWCLFLRSDYTELPVCTSACRMVSWGRLLQALPASWPPSRPLVSSDLCCPEMVTMNPQESSVLGATLLAVEIQPLSYE